ncbi:MAG: FHA domain-containing protein, partial [Myxococcota bacterium]
PRKSGMRPMPRRPSGPPPSSQQQAGPDERTMALDLDTMRKGAAQIAASQPKPQVLDAEARTMAMSIDDLRKGPPSGSSPGPLPSAPPSSGLRPMPQGLANNGGGGGGGGQLSPAERTVAMDIPTGPGGPPMGPPPSVAGDSTTVLDEKMFKQAAAAAAAVAQESTAKLIVFAEGAQQPVTFNLRPGITNVGRDRSNHLVLTDQFASRKHLLIKKSNTGFEMRDNGSDNVTLVNGNETTRHILRHGDEIVVGSTVLRFILGTPTQQDLAWPATPPQPGQMTPGPMPAASPGAGLFNSGSGNTFPIVALIILGCLIFGSLVLVIVLFAFVL